MRKVPPSLLLVLSFATPDRTVVLSKRAIRQTPVVFRRLLEACYSVTARRINIGNPHLQQLVGLPFVMGPA
jgi:hypothetical protein